MRLSNRFNSYKVEQDALSTYLGSFDFRVEYFSDWPDQANKKLTNISPMRTKLVLQERGICQIQHKGEEYVL